MDPGSSNHVQGLPTETGLIPSTLTLSPASFEPSSVHVHRAPSFIVNGATTSAARIMGAFYGGLAIEVVLREIEVMWPSHFQTLWP